MTSKFGGFFSSLKKEVLTIGQTKTTDQHFDTAKQNYDSFVSSCTLVKQHIDTWQSTTKGMCVNSELIAGDFKHLMQQTTTHPFSALSGDGKATQSANFKHFEVCEKQLEVTCGAKLRLLTAHFNNIKDRMKARESARLDFDYRTGQVKSAQESRDKLIAKGKSEAAKDAEKRVLAEKKLEDATALWNTLNTQLVNDLVHLHENRLSLVGNIYIEFLSVQKAFAAGFANNMDLLSVPSVPASCPFVLLANEAKSESAPSGEGFQDVNLNPSHGGKPMSASGGVASSGGNPFTAATRTPPY